METPVEMSLTRAEFLVRYSAEADKGLPLASIYSALGSGDGTWENEWIVKWGSNDMSDLLSNSPLLFLSSLWASASSSSLESLFGSGLKWITSECAAVAMADVAESLSSARWIRYSSIYSIDSLSSRPRRLLIFTIIVASFLRTFGTWSLYSCMHTTRLSCLKRGLGDFSMSWSTISRNAMRRWYDLLESSLDLTDEQRKSRACVDLRQLVKTITMEWAATRLISLFPSARHRSNIVWYLSTNSFEESSLMNVSKHRSSSLSTRHAGEVVLPSA